MGQLARLASSVPLYAATALVITLTFVRDYTGILNLLRYLSIQNRCSHMCHTVLTSYSPSTNLLKRCRLPEMLTESDNDKFLLALLVFMPLATGDISAFNQFLKPSKFTLKLK